MYLATYRLLVYHRPRGDGGLLFSMKFLQHVPRASLAKMAVLGALLLYFHDLSRRVPASIDYTADAVAKVESVKQASSATKNIASQLLPVLGDWAGAWATKSAETVLSVSDSLEEAADTDTALETTKLALEAQRFVGALEQHPAASMFVALLCENAAIHDEVVSLVDSAILWCTANFLLVCYEIVLWTLIFYLSSYNEAAAAFITGAPEAVSKAVSDAAKTLEDRYIELTGRMRNSACRQVAAALERHRGNTVALVWRRMYHNFIREGFTPPAINAFMPSDDEGFLSSAPGFGSGSGNGSKGMNGSTDPGLDSKGSTEEHYSELTAIGEQCEGAVRKQLCNAEAQGRHLVAVLWEEGLYAVFLFQLWCTTLLPCVDQFAAGRVLAHQCLDGLLYPTIPKTTAWLRTPAVSEALGDAQTRRLADALSLLPPIEWAGVPQSPMLQGAHWITGNQWVPGTLKVCIMVLMAAAVLPGARRCVSAIAQFSQRVSADGEATIQSVGLSCARATAIAGTAVLCASSAARACLQEAVGGAVLDLAVIDSSMNETVVVGMAQETWIINSFVLPLLQSLPSDVQAVAFADDVVNRDWSSELSMLALALGREHLGMAALRPLLRPADE